MRMLYLPPETQSVVLQTESLVCQSNMDKGSGTISPVTSLDFNDDIWAPIL